jgi:hypothetical protein
MHIQCHITRQRGSASQCRKGDSPFLWQTPKFDPLQIRNGWTDRYKILYDCLHRQDLAIGLIRLQSAVRWHLGYAWNITYAYLFIFFNLLFLRRTPTARTERRRKTNNGSNDADSCKDVPFMRVSLSWRLSWGSNPQKPPFWGRE